MVGLTPELRFDSIEAVRFCNDRFVIGFNDQQRDDLVAFLKAMQVPAIGDSHTKPSPSNDRGHARRVIVTLLITTTAAVTAGVALQKHPHGEAVVQAADASPAAMSSSDPSLPAAADALQRSTDASAEPAMTF